MTPRVLCLLALLAVFGIGCGGDEGGESSGRGAETSAATASPAEESEDRGPKKGAWGVVFGAEGERGIILYDLSGHTLYAFSKDRGASSTCYGACARTWTPALTEGKARADGEASSKLVGTTKRRDGTVQLTYAGQPLYTYSRDRSAEIRGDGLRSFGGEWYALRPDGQAL